MPEPANLISPWRIGIDVGGTFTDVVLVDRTGVVRAHKSPSEPANPAVGVLNALAGTAAALGLGVDDLLKGCSHLVHGTTVATNVLLERKGAKVGLLTTQGMRDTLEIRRGYRELMWDHRTPWRDVLVPRSLRLPLTERIDARGKVVTPLDMRSLEHAARRLADAQVEAVAICFLHAYANDGHERQCFDWLTAHMPGVFVTRSSEVAPVVGEFERTSTTVANAYVGPKIIPYLKELSRELTSRGLDKDILLIQSNGGAISLGQVATRPAALALSGPAAGLTALRMHGAMIGSDDLISIEIGGTSCDVTVVNAGRIGQAESVRVDDTLIALPSVDIHTIAIGGGTICRVDAGGMVHVGPHGAGARPGPACYGRGGSLATLTDAQVVLGRLAPGVYAGGSLSIADAPAEAAVLGQLATPLGISATRAAKGAIDLAEQSIQHAIEKVSLERGLDPRKFVLIGAGGAGALHAVNVARKLGMERVVIPALAGVFCALGMCNADIRHDLLKPLGQRLEASLYDALARAIAELRGEGAARLETEGFDPSTLTSTAGLDLRYEGQQWTVHIPVQPREFTQARGEFDRQHLRLYGSMQPDAHVEVVNVRVAVQASLPTPDLKRHATASQASPIGPSSVRLVWLDDPDHAERVAVYTGREFRPGDEVSGPALIEASTTTALINRGDKATVDAFGNLVISIGQVRPRTGFDA